MIAKRKMQVNENKDIILSFLREYRTEIHGHLKLSCVVLSGFRLLSIGRTAVMDFFIVRIQSDGSNLAAT